MKAYRLRPQPVRQEIQAALNAIADTLPRLRLISALLNRESRVGHRWLADLKIAASEV